MSTWVCACICFSFVPEMIERMKVWYVIEFWHKCTEGLKNLIRISSIRNNKKYPTIKKIFEAGDFYAILSDIVEKITVYLYYSICNFNALGLSNLMVVLFYYWREMITSLHIYIILFGQYCFVTWSYRHSSAIVIWWSSMKIPLT